MVVVELNRSGTMEFSPQGRRAQRIFRVTPYTDAEAFCVQKLGSQRLGSDELVLRTPPEAFASNSSLYALRCRVEGLGKPQTDVEGNIDYDGGAKITVEYGTLPFRTVSGSGSPDDPQSQTFLTEEISFNAEFLSLPQQKFQWQSDSEELGNEDVSPGKLVPKAEWVLTRHHVPSLPRETIFAALGKVNSTPLSGAAAETLLFAGAQARREISSEGEPSWKITYTFLYNAQTHNKFFRGATNQWEQVVTKEGSHLVYQQTDLKQLFPELR